MEIRIPQHVVVKSPIPPENPIVGTLWDDTSDPETTVSKYWDSQWVRMDGGGRVPDGHITEDMLSPELRRKLVL